MIEHVTEWLGPYLDGELHGLHKQQVEAHLNRCAACRSEMESLQALSGLLQTDPGQPLPSTEKFIARLTLALPRRHATAPRRKAWPVVWWFVPTGIMITWVALQLTSWLIDIAAALQGAGLTGSTVSWLHLPSQAAWFSASMSLFGGQLSAGGKSTLAFFNQADLFLQNFAISLAWQAALVGLYWTWLTIGWIRYRTNTIAQAKLNLPQTSNPS
jgi:anti-sigma factor RsiW